MALSNYTYWLRPQAGDTAPHDELGLSADLSGGTITLVDDGAGGKAWRFVGTAQAAGPSFAPAVAAAGGGVTVAIEMRVITAGGSTGTLYAGYKTADANPYGTFIAFSSSTQISCRYRTGAGINATGAYTHGTGWVTYILKLKCDTGASTDFVQVWTTGAAGHPTPDLTSAGFGASAVTMARIECGNSSATLEIRGLATWAEELSDADCSTLAASGLSATLGGGSSFNASWARGSNVIL